MKKTLLPALALALLLAGSLPVGVWAHGNGCGANRTANSYALCATADCNTVGVHQHADTYYAGHTLQDGHDYHQLCARENCTLTGVHEHDGVACFPHSSGDGHAYHRGGGNGWHH